MTPTLKPCELGNTHYWMYYACAQCISAGMTDPEIETFLDPLLARPARPGELEETLQNARARIENGELNTTPKWPIRDGKLIRAIQDTNISTWTPPPAQIDAERVIDLLFPGNPLLCIGASTTHFVTKPREEWRGTLARNSFIVPSPMTALQGRTKAGEMSAHSIDNTGSRHYLVIENDWATPEEQIKFLQHLAQYARLVVACSSGGKSIHGYFDFRDRTEDEAEKFMRYAVRTTGADPHTFGRSHFCRLPGGKRENGNLQKILYLYGRAT